MFDLRLARQDRVPQFPLRGQGLAPAFRAETLFDSGGEGEGIRCVVDVLRIAILFFIG